jgi:hypothetical protein
MVATKAARVMAIAKVAARECAAMAIAKVTGRERATTAMSGVPGVIRNADGHCDGATAPSR